MEEQSQKIEEFTSEEIIKRRQSGIKTFFKNNFVHIIYILLILILILNVQIRTLPMETHPNTGKPGLWDIAQDQWTLGPDLDPFVFLRGAERIVEDGSLGEVDTLRYYPFGYDTSGETKILPYTIAGLHNILIMLGIGPGVVVYAAIILPVLFSIFTALAFFLLTRKIFEDKGKYISNIIGLLSTLFLITLPSLLPRTIAGIPEKESMGFTFMFFALYFFIKAWKNKDKNLILAIIAGIFTALMALVWGGVIFVYISIAISGAVSYLMGKVDKKEVIVYGAWLVSSVIFWVPFTARMSLQQFMRSSTSGIAVIVFILIFTYYILFKTKLGTWANKIKDKTPLLNKLPTPLYVLIISFIFILILFTLLLGPSSLMDLTRDILNKLTQPYTARHAFTVAENRQPYFSDWRAILGPIIRGIPLFFWMFFAGSILLFNQVIKNYKIKERTILSVGYIYFLIALIFSRSSPTDILNGETPISILFYVSGFIILFGSIFYVAYHKWKRGDSIEVDANIGYIFMFSLIFVSIVAARSAIRLIMFLAAIAVIPMVYLIVQTVIIAFKKRKEEMIGTIIVFLAIALIICGGVILKYQYDGSIATGMNHVPSSYTHQWQYAMKWVQENTSEDAAFGMWWDYGYWIQSMGQRATMLDGGNSYSYWNYLMGRHGLTADSESEALQLFYSHNLTHFLIDSTEIVKYSAYSNIGSDENMDKFSWIGTFHLDYKQTKETRDGETYIYSGGIALDEDLVINKTLLPSPNTGVGAMTVPVENNSLLQPTVIMFYSNQQYSFPLRYAYYQGRLYDFGEGIEGCMYIIPKFIDGQGYDSKGSALFLSPRNMRALWVHMYLLNEGDNFELVHTESNAVVKSLRAQGVPSEELIYYRGLQGPIKIWEIKYIGDEILNEEYLLKSFPEDLLGRQ